MLAGVVLAQVCVGSCYSQDDLKETLRKFEDQRRAAELEIERARVRQLQFDADIARMRAVGEQLDADNRRFWADREAKETAEKERQEADRRSWEVTKAAKEAEEAAERMRVELVMAGVRTRNSAYLFGLLVAFAGFVAFVIKLKRRTAPMERHEKFGLVTIISSFLLATLALMISSHWIVNLDFLNNLMATLSIEFFADEQQRDKFLIDVPTKYVLLACLFVASYGVTTYLGITPAPRAGAMKDTSESSVTD